jgi:hypothetical protein
MTKDNIVDASKPSAGRMYDYYLGGNHNFEVDRQTADQVVKLLPFTTKYVRLQRWALQDIATELTEKRGYDVIIDFASGLPTQDHIHFKVKKGTTVIYSDYDPIVVEYTRDILKDTPNTYFFQGDARHPEELLSRPEVEKILNGRKKIAFIYWGVSAFLDDADLIAAAQVLYNWSAPGSCWVFNVQNLNQNNPSTMQVLDIYKQLGAPLRLREPEACLKLLQPWKPEGEGFISLLEWHGFDQSELGGEGAEAFGPLGGGYGAYLVK